MDYEHLHKEKQGEETYYSESTLIGILVVIAILLLIVIFFCVREIVQRYRNRKYQALVTKEPEIVDEIEATENIETIGGAVSKFQNVEIQNTEKQEVASKLRIHYGEVLTSEGYRSQEDFDESKEFILDTTAESQRVDLNATCISSVLSESRPSIGSSLDESRDAYNTRRRESSLSVLHESKDESVASYNTGKSGKRKELKFSMDESRESSINERGESVTSSASRKSSLYKTKKSGSRGKKKFFQLYYPVGDDLTVLETSIFTSRWKGYLAGQILVIDKIPIFEEGGPTHVKVHVTLLPAKRRVYKSAWIDVTTQGRCVMNDYYKCALDRYHPEKEKNLRIRAYGTLNPDIGSTKCVGECLVDIDELEKERAGLKFTISLSRKRNKKGLLHLMEDSD